MQFQSRFPLKRFSPFAIWIAYGHNSAPPPLACVSLAKNYLNVRIVIPYVFFLPRPLTYPSSDDVYL